MANPFGEKNIGPWEGQQVEYIPLDDLVLWTENPRDPLDGDYTNDDVIRRATDGRNEKQWQLSKLSKEMGDRFDLSELPTVCRIDDGPKYRVYDGNRRVILAMLRKAGLTTEGQQQLVPPDFPDPIPCNVCDEETALENVERKHRGNGSWKQYERDRFMFDYRGGPKTVLIRLEELIKAVTKWPALNMRYVEDDVFNKKHLEEMGLLPDEPDFGVPLELLEELVEAVADKLDNELNTRNARNDPASVLPGELMDRIREARHRRPAGEKADGRERELPSDNSEPPSQSHGGPGRDDALRPDTSGTLPPHRCIRQEAKGTHPSGQAGIHSRVREPFGSTAADGRRQQHVSHFGGTVEHVCARRHAECRRVRADLSHGAASADRYGRHGTMRRIGQICGRVCRGSEKTSQAGGKQR